MSHHIRVRSHLIVSIHNDLANSNEKDDCVLYILLIGYFIAVVSLQLMERRNIKRKD